MANRNYASGGKIYSMRVKPVLVDCSFIVNATDTGGLGITSLKGPLVQAVYMHTSATPSALNPNPASGTIIIQLQDNYNVTLVPEMHAIQSSLGTPLLIDASSAALTAGVAYVITTVGNATAAQWLALGVPSGVTPAVGVSFIALVTGSGASSTARVAPTAAAGSGVASIEVVGDPNTSIAPNPSSTQGFGAQIILQCRDYAGAIVAPTNLTKISIAMYLNDSSVLTSSNS